MSNISAITQKQIEDVLLPSSFQDDVWGTGEKHFVLVDPLGTGDRGSFQVRVLSTTSFEIGIGIIHNTLVKAIVKSLPFEGTQVFLKVEIGYDTGFYREPPYTREYRKPGPVSVTAEVMLVKIGESVPSGVNTPSRIISYRALAVIRRATLDDVLPSVFGFIVEPSGFTNGTYFFNVRPT